jgi:hypothetical protein
MNVQIGTEAAQFPEKEYINGIAVAVGGSISAHTCRRIHILAADGFPSLA